MRRGTPFADIVRHLIPFFVSRQVICGAGRVGIGADGRGSGFQISQRADFFEVEVGLETTLKRPIINTRDEPHADPEKYRRLHVIIGDANLSEVVDLPQGRHDRAGARDDRGQVPGRRPVDRGPGGRAARDLARPDLPPPGHAQGRPEDDRRPAAVPSTSSWPASSPRTSTGTTSTSITVDVLDRWESVLNRLAEDPMQLSQGTRLGGQARAARGLPRPGTAWTGTTRGCSWSTCSTPTCARTGACTTGWPPGAGWSRLTDDATVNRAIDEPAGGHPGLLPRPLPARSTRSRWRPPRGTR